MKNCDSCGYFIKIKSFNDGRKGICGSEDYNIGNMKRRKPCKYYSPKKYDRRMGLYNIIE